MEPFPRCSTPWSKAGGSRPATLSVLKNLWEQYLKLEALNLDDRPEELWEVKAAQNHCDAKWKTRPVPKAKPKAQP